LKEIQRNYSSINCTKNQGIELNTTWPADSLKKDIVKAEHKLKNVKTKESFGLI
jgi:hypothetical protein